MMHAVLLFYEQQAEADAVIRALHPLLGYPMIVADYAPPVVVAPQWWEGLPMKAGLVTTRETPVYFQPGREIRNQVPAGTEMEYWGAAIGGYVCVYDGAFQLWVAADAVKVAD